MKHCGAKKVCKTLEGGQGSEYSFGRNYDKDIKCYAICDH